MMTLETTVEDPDLVWETSEPIWLDGGQDWAILARCSTHWMDWEVHECLGLSQPGGTPLFQDNPATPMASNSPVPTEHSCIMNGFIKWDGCTQWWHPNDPWHHDSIDTIPDLRAIVGRIRELAKQHMPKWGP